jgi:hypothetical protein
MSKEETKISGPTFFEFMKPVFIFTFNEIVTIPILLFFLSPFLYDTCEIQKNFILKYFGGFLILFGLYLYYETYSLFYRVGKGTIGKFIFLKNLQKHHGLHQKT